MRRNILLVVAGAALVLASAFYLAISLRRSVEVEVLSQTRKHHAILAYNAARTVEAHLHAHAESLLVLSMSPAVRQGDLTQAAAALSGALQVHVMEETYLETLSLYDGRGQLLYSTSNAGPPDGRGWEALFQWAATRGREGRAFVLPFNRPPRQKGGPGRVGAVIAVPVELDAPLAAQRQVAPGPPAAGFLTLTLDLEALLSNALSRLDSRNPASALWVVTSDGMLVFHQAHPEMVLRSIDRGDQSCAQCHISFGYVQQALTAKQGFAEYALRTGPRMLAAYTPMRFANLSWIIVVSTPLDQPTAVISRLGWQIIALMGLAVVTAVAGAGAMYRTYRAGIRALEAARYWHEREEFTQRLQRSEERYRTIVESSHDLIAVFDRDGVIRFVNQQALTLLGYEAAELLGTPSGRLVETADLPALQRAFAEAVSGGSPAEVEVRVRAKSGTTRVVSLSLVPVAAGADQTGVLASARDVTAEKEAEKGAKRLEEQLRQAQKLEGVGRLAGGVAHDFNNLLTVILGHGEFALEQVGDNGPIRGDIQEIMKAARSAESLTRQLLAFSRKQILQPVLLDLNTVVAETSKMLRRLIGEDIEVVTVLAPELGRVRADLGQIEQVLVNLAVNARDAMPEGGRLTIETATVDLDSTPVRTHGTTVPGRYVMLAVSDTGCGMTPEIQSHLFEPFFTTKEPGKGTGLGLATVYGIVTQSGGTISVYSEPGDGSTFKIYLPCVASAAETPRPIDAELPPRPATETLLLVEDNDGVRELARRVLERAGYEVLTARGPADALTLCTGHPKVIHVLLTDIVMPGMHGRELAARVAALRPDIRVLYMSGHTDHAVVHDGRLDPGVVFVQKPFTATTLERAVRRALESGGSQGSRSADHPA